LGGFDVIVKIFTKKIMNAVDVDALHVEIHVVKEISLDDESKNGMPVDPLSSEIKGQSNLCMSLLDVIHVRV
jgi:hypothetical protein